MTYLVIEGSEAMDVSKSQEENLLRSVRALYLRGDISQPEFEDRVGAIMNGEGSAWLMDPSDFWRHMVNMGIGRRR